MSGNPFNAYDLLNIESNATESEIKTAFKLMAQEHHPDKHGNLKTANILFKILLESKDILLDPNRRLVHDYANGIKERPKSHTETVFRNESEPKTDWASLMFAGVAGLAIGAALVRRSKNKKLQSK